MESKMKLKDGKFFRDGNPVPLEFGNAEQIRLINEQQEQIRALTHEGYWIEPNVYPYENGVRADVEFDCLCGNRIWIMERADSIGKSWDALCRKSHTCSKCNRSYKISHSIEWGFPALALKLTKQKH